MVDGKLARGEGIGEGIAWEAYDAFNPRGWLGIGRLLVIEDNDIAIGGRKCGYFVGTFPSKESGAWDKCGGHGFGWHSEPFKAVERVGCEKGVEGEKSCRCGVPEGFGLEMKRFDGWEGKGGQKGQLDKQ